MVHPGVRRVLRDGVALRLSPRVVAIWNGRGHLGGTGNAALEAGPRSNFATGETNKLSQRTNRRPSSSLDWPTLLPCLSPWPTIHPAPPNGTPSSILFLPRCHETGLVNRSTPTRRSSTIREPQKLKPALPSLLTWIAVTILAASNHLQTNSPHCDCSAMKPYPSGTTPSNLNCEVVLAWRLSPIDLIALIALGPRKTDKLAESWTAVGP